MIDILNKETKEFHIFPCKICGKVPNINKDLSKTGDNKYCLSHCETVANGYTETLCIVNWNKKNKPPTTKLRQEN